jgi:hypothetical protein
MSCHPSTGPRRTVRSELVIGMASLLPSPTDTALVACGWPVRELRLAVTPEGGDEEVQSFALTPADTLRIPVDVAPGTTQFRVEVWSNTDSLLFVGQTRQDVTGDGFSVPVPLTPVAPVMVVCPRAVTITGVSYEAQVDVMNVGIDSLQWTPPAYIDGASGTMWFFSGSAVGPNGSEPFYMGVNGSFPDTTIVVVVHSPYGNVPIEVTTRLGITGAPAGSDRRGPAAAHRRRPG